MHLVASVEDIFVPSLQKITSFHRQIILYRIALDILCVSFRVVTVPVRETRLFFAPAPAFHASRLSFVPGSSQRTHVSRSLIRTLPFPQEEEPLCAQIAFDFSSLSGRRSRCLVNLTDTYVQNGRTLAYDARMRVQLIGA